MCIGFGGKGFGILYDVVILKYVDNMYCFYKKYGNVYDLNCYMFIVIEVVDCVGWFGEI